MPQKTVCVCLTLYLGSAVNPGEHRKLRGNYAHILESEHCKGPRISCICMCISVCVSTEAAFAKTTLVFEEKEKKKRHLGSGN